MKKVSPQDREDSFNSENRKQSGLSLNNSLFWQAWRMGNIWVNVAESIQTRYEGLDSKTIRFLYDLKSQMIL